MKRLIVWLLVSVLAFSCAWGVGAASAQEVTYTPFGETSILTVKHPPSAWEAPTLRAGEALSEAGVLTLSNSTGAPVTLVLDYVELPFANRTALAYLNHVTVTVSRGAEVLYNGPYTRINDEETGLSLRCPLQAGETATYTVDLRCGYGHTGEGTGFGEDEYIDWKFYAVQEATNDVAQEPAAPFADPTVRELVLVAFVAVVLLLGVGAYEVWRRRNRY